MRFPSVRFTSLTLLALLVVGCDQRGPTAPSSEPTGNTTLPPPVAETKVEPGSETAASETAASETAASETAASETAAAESAAVTPKEPPVEAKDTPNPRKPKNVILLVVDAMRDDMPWNGYERPIAPNLSRLHKLSTSYERGYAISSFTSKSVGGMLSGHYPSSLNRTTSFFTKYRDKDNTFLAETLHESGVRSLGVQAHMYLEEKSGLQQGFDDWRMVPGIQWDPNKDPFVTSPQHTKTIIEQLSEPKNSSGRFFAYYHYMDPHDVYQSHDEAPKWGKTNRDLYDQEIWYTDLYIQKTLDFVWSQPWGKDTAVIVTADHGEAFGEHGFYRHARHLYEVLIRVPLFVHIPGVEGRTISRWRSHIDLVPTIYDLMGLPIPKDLPGTSLLPEILGEEQPQRPIIADLPADSINIRRRAFIDEEGYKLVAYGGDVRFEMFNVRDDPAEKENLYRSDKERASAMRDRYGEISKSIPFREARGGKPVKPD